MPASIVDLDDINKKVPSPEITLLLVEDEVIVAEDVRRRLEGMGYRVVGIANRGKDAIAMAENLKPRVILMDIGLRGGMDGIETVRQIREKLDVPIIFASAYSDDATLQRARAVDAQGFVLKPLEERELRTTIDMALHKHALDRRLRTNESLFRRVFEHLPDGVLVETSARRVELANSAFFRIFGIPQTVALKGEDTRTGLGRHMGVFEDSAVFVRRLDAIVQADAGIVEEQVQTSDGRTILITYTPIKNSAHAVEHLWLFHDAGPVSKRG